MRIETIMSLFQTLRQKYYDFRILLYELLTDGEIEGTPQKMQPCIFTGQGKVIFGSNVVLGYCPSPYYWNTYCYFDTRSKNSIIKIGSNVITNNNFSCCALGELTIGESTLIGPNVVIMDFDGHNIDPTCRNSGCGRQGNILIGKNVWIGSNALVLKGVTIGDNSVIAAGSVVVKSIPPNVVAAGNPCRVVKNI